MLNKILEKFLTQGFEFKFYRFVTVLKDLNFQILTGFNGVKTGGRICEVETMSWDDQSLVNHVMCTEDTCQEPTRQSAGNLRLSGEIQPVSFGGGFKCGGVIRLHRRNPPPAHQTTRRHTVQRGKR